LIIFYIHVKHILYVNSSAVISTLSVQVYAWARHLNLFSYWVKKYFKPTLIIRNKNYWKAADLSQSWMYCCGDKNS